MADGRTDRSDENRLLVKRVSGDEKPESTMQETLFFWPSYEVYWMIILNMSVTPLRAGLAAQTQE